MKFYVYEHWRPDTDLPFYVGKGKGRRAFVLKRNNRQHTFVVAKLSDMGMCVEIRMVASGLSEVDAFWIEKDRIKFWRDNGVRLTNVADGGGGAAGFQHSDEFKEKARAQMIAYNAKRGPTSEETRKRMSSAKLGKKQSQEHVSNASSARRGIKTGPLPIEVRKKISLAKTGSRASEKTRSKMSASHTGKVSGPCPPERAMKISASLSGRPWSEKRRAAQLQRFQEKTYG